MPKPTDVCVRDVVATTAELPYRASMKFGGRVVTSATLLNVAITVETRDSRCATGFGSMPLGNIWSWPSQVLAPDQTLAAMRRFADLLVPMLQDFGESGHPLEIMHAVGKRYAELAQRVEREQSLPESIPRLAQLVAASPFDAALHDAFGRALDRNSYDLLGSEFANRELAAYLNADFAGEYLDRYTLRTPQPRLPLYHLVGALDPLSSGDITDRLQDGLPETLGEWIAAEGLTHLKIKLDGRDLNWDVNRVCSVDQVARQTKPRYQDWKYSLDFNERCEHADYVLELLARAGERSAVAVDRIQYIEQPTPRNLRAHPDHRMHAVAKVKPVVIDESLVDFDSFLLARELGYSGVALKACKGHTDALMLGAAAQKYGLFLCVQDLTCPGASFLHSATLSARIPSVAAMEGNARQYCPAGNDGWRERFPSMFRITDGTLGTGVLAGPGLGF